MSITVSNYPAPDNRIMRWIAWIGDDLPEEVQSRLRSTFFTSRGPPFVGAANSVVMAVVVYSVTLRPIFLALAFCDFLLLAVRAALVKRTSAPTGPVFAAGLAWAMLQGVTILLVVISDNLVLSMVVMAGGFGAIGGIVGRNFAAPRYAILQAVIIDASFKLPFGYLNPQFIPLLAFQGILFILMNIALLRQHRTRAIAAIQGELDSRRQAFTDPLTGLGNRRSLEQHFAGLQHEGRRCALLYMDLDGFKGINDRFGHGAGDRLLQIVGNRLTERCGPDAFPCRLGGDEFLVIMNGAGACEAAQFAALLIASVAAPYELAEGVLARIDASVGIAIDADGTLPLLDLMGRADRALYQAKASKKGSFVLHDDLEPDAFKPSGLAAAVRRP